MHLSTLSTHISHSEQSVDTEILQAVMSLEINSSHRNSHNINKLRANVTSDEFLRKIFSV